MGFFSLHQNAGRVFYSQKKHLFSGDNMLYTQKDEQRKLFLSDQRFFWCWRDAQITWIQNCIQIVCMFTVNFLKFSQKFLSAQFIVYLSLHAIHKQFSAPFFNKKLK